jgi:hypothetical protein
MTLRVVLDATIGIHISAKFLENSVALKYTQLPLKIWQISDILEQQQQIKI